MKICKHYVISGRVQGVFFRQGTLEQAKELNLTGWVRNLNNGDVECLVCGDSEAVDNMEQWLKQGPPAAQVQQLKSKSLAWEKHDSFEIKR